MSVAGPICGGCPLEHKGTIYIPFDGAGTNKVLLVGDSGWIQEERNVRVVAGRRVGTPFSGPSGYFIERNLKRIGASRGEFTVANSFWCRAPHLGYTDHPEKFPDAALAMEHCRPYLDNLIERMQPKAIVPMGNVALRRITGLSGIERHNAYYIPTPYGIPAIPTFHPSFIIRGNHKLSGLWCYAVKRALDVAKRDERPKDYHLWLDPSLSAAEAYFANGHDPLVCDIETPEPDDEPEDEREDSSYTIVRISFSTRAGTAVSMPWQPPYVELAKRILAQAGEVVFWNQAFDLPRLKANGCEIKGKVVDAMFAWHFLQSDLPKALGFVAPLFTCLEPWKQMSGSAPARYSALDSAITMDTYLGIRAQLEAEGRWAAFERHCIDVFPILVRMSEAGVKLDLDRQAKFRAKLEVERDEALAKLQTQVPEEVKPTKHYKREPKDMSSVVPNPDGGWDRILPFNPASPLQVKNLISHLGLPIPRAKGEDRESTEAKHLKALIKKNTIFRDILDYREREKLITSYMWPVTKEDFSETIWVEAQIENLQGSGLSAKSVGAGNVQHALHKGLGKKDELPEAALRQGLSLEASHSLHSRAGWVGLATRSWEEMPLLQKEAAAAHHPSLGHGQVKWVKGESGGHLLFVPQQVSRATAEIGTVLLPFQRALALGKVTTQFSFHPSTWRKSSRNPNVQTIPKRNDLAQEFRKMIVARPGHVLIECDSSAIEAVLVGFYAGSQKYIDLAKRGVHKWLATEYAGRAVSKEEPLYDQIKRVVHLSNYMGTPHRIHEEYPDVFASVKVARELQEFYFSTPAGQDVRKWQQTTMEQAHKERYLEIPWKYRHYFYDVFHYSDGQWVMGDDAKRAVAFRPQATASAIQTEFLLRIEQRDTGPLDELRKGLRWIVHDSIIAEVPQVVGEICAKALLDVMTIPHPLLGGLAIGAECKIGPSLGEMRAIA